MDTWQRTFDVGDDRVAKVEVKCSLSALQFLTDLRSHPRFAHVIARLESIHDTISRADVEDALASLHDKEG